MGKPQPTDTFQMQLQPSMVSFDPTAFDELIKANGVELVHYTAMPCPVGLTDPDDIRQTHAHHEDCSNGFIYTRAGTVTCGFLGNSKESHFADAGRIDGSTVNAVIPRFYDDKPEESVYFTSFDRVYLKEEAITVVTFNKYQAHVSGVDRLTFPVVHVINLVDAFGKRYKECVHFTVRDGQIHWKEGEGPGIDPSTGKGVVFSARFTYRPYWIVKNMVHEVRVAQNEDEFFNRTTLRMPQQCALQREYHYFKSANDDQAKDPEKRQKPGPATGGFGPR